MSRKSSLPPRRKRSHGCQCIVDTDFASNPARQCLADRPLSWAIAAAKPEFQVIRRAIATLVQKEGDRERSAGLFLQLLPNATNRLAGKFVSDGTFGGPGRDRTDDLFHAMEARSQLRHRPTSGRINNLILAYAVVIVKPISSAFVHSVEN